MKIRFNELALSDNLKFMKAHKYRIALFSDNPDRLARFYTETLGFRETAKVDTKDDYGYSIAVSDGYKIWIAKHSEIKGKNTNPFRIMISIYVDDIKSYFEAIKTKESVSVIEHPTLTCEGIKGEERLVGAFLDPDGNYIQLMQLTGN